MLMKSNPSTHHFILDDVQPLLVTRTTARKMLGVKSIIQMQRLEEQGTLTPIRLNKKSKNGQGQVYYNYAQLVALACPTVDTKVEEEEERPRVRRRKSSREARAGS